MKKTLKILKDYMIYIVAILAFISILIGMKSPEFFKPLKVTLPVALFAMLYPMMIGINLKSMFLKKTREKTIYLVLLNIFYLVVFPLLTFLLMKLFIAIGVDNKFLAGIVLISLAPIPSSAAAFTGLANGKVQLTIIGVTWTFILAIIVMPLYSKIMLNTVIRVPIWSMIESLIIYIFTPLILAQLTKYFIVKKSGEDKLKSLKPLFSLISLLGTYWMVFVVFGLNGKLIAKNPALILVSALIMNAYFLLRFGIAYLAGTIARLPLAQKISLFYSSGTNMTIATAIAIYTFGPLAAVGVAMGGPFSDMILMILFVRLFEKLTERENAKEALQEE
jgi:ACR3 family arsenite transporter